MSTGTREVAVVAVGACTPVGLTAAVTRAERAAGTPGFTRTEVRGEDGESVRAARLRLLEAWLSRTQRMAALGATALEDCLAAVKGRWADSRLPLVLVLPEDGLGAPWEETALREALEAEARPARLEWEEGPWRAGRAGLFAALAHARRVLREGRAPWVLVGGVDSLGDGLSLRRLVETGRCLSGGRGEGLIPGEGAGFLLLARAEEARRARLEVAGWVLAEAHGQEARHFRQEAPGRAEALTEVFRQLRWHPGVEGRRVDVVLSCQTGEGYWAREFGQAYLRNAELFPEPLVVREVAEGLGDVGAAAGALQVAQGLYLLRKQGGGRGLVYGDADGGVVGACVLEVAS
ncbi:beta-ketoacyl synthase N-terminal-like domain-containing protein [Myxococcus sp. RHSTA-1-4]|uniref:beta-ketoacyl synthase N-terminal-like domain-containing protein n=1 Tax=Myxococcus sp. RHSTA-1-4 TaxID=2874601 RepID=UPI001CBD9500|nr:beta-ketoacyl synthase N-terminal-like domain-containing protein [Myxococcus sp. RHSTA-1-4]MBZ4417982.1 3-oxoacyl-ACP synthase [Myxococcus sp. RHSTA-1-4]